MGTKMRQLKERIKDNQLVETSVLPLIRTIRHYKNHIKSKILKIPHMAAGIRITKNGLACLSIPYRIQLKEQFEKERRETFTRDIKISILVPLYNTPPKYLREMIESVLKQTYSNWELCLADGSDSGSETVGDVCRKYLSDSRIHYLRLKHNLGIAENTNACLGLASGDYIALLDHDDRLHPSALYEAAKAICETDADFLYTDECIFRRWMINITRTFYKPDFSPDTLRSYNYICHFSVFSRKLLDSVGGKLQSRFDGAQDYDLILRLTEKAEKIVHVQKNLYYWRKHVNSVASSVATKPYAIVAAKAAIKEHMDRVGLKGMVEDSSVLSTYRIRYDIGEFKKISILIPNKDHVDDLKKCISSVLEKTTYSPIEIIVIENNSVEQETFNYYKEIEKNPLIRIFTWKGKFNYSAINNFGAQYANGEYILLLNNDVEIITPDWLEQMVMFAQRQDVGAVGAMLYYPDDTVQHAGVVVGLGGVAGHIHRHFPRGEGGYAYRMSLAQNLSAVTGACLLMRREIWDEVNGLDEKFEVAFNDIDLCMRIREKGYLIIWTPYAELYHYESKSRGKDVTPEAKKRFAGEKKRFRERWKKELEQGDPYYNTNLSLYSEICALKNKPDLFF